MPTTYSKWQNTWLALGLSKEAVPFQLYHDLIANYNEPHRHYHTLQHIFECLENFEALRLLVNHPEEIELALWFHDAIYQPERQDNEELSADWARSCANSAGLDKLVRDRVYGLIMATRHHVKPHGMAAKVLVDVDLAILGANAVRYQEYSEQIRQEYAFVPDLIFKAKRAEILRNFLKQSTLFNTPLFIERYEQQARKNISHELETLSP